MICAFERSFPRQFHYVLQLKPHNQGALPYENCFFACFYPMIDLSSWPYHRCNQLNLDVKDLKLLQLLSDFL